MLCNDSNDFLLTRLHFFNLAFLVFLIPYVSSGRTLVSFVQYSAMQHTAQSKL